MVDSSPKSMFNDAGTGKENYNDLLLNAIFCIFEVHLN